MDWIMHYIRSLIEREHICNVQILFYMFLLDKCKYLSELVYSMTSNNNTLTITIIWNPFILLWNTNRQRRISKQPIFFCFFFFFLFNMILKMEQKKDVHFLNGNFFPVTLPTLPMYCLKFLSIRNESKLLCYGITKWIIPPHTVLPPSSFYATMKMLLETLTISLFCLILKE